MLITVSKYIIRVLFIACALMNKFFNLSYQNGETCHLLEELDIRTLSDSHCALEGSKGGRLFSDWHGDTCFRTGPSSSQ